MSQACLLAAGRGRRAGGPKAWLESAGSTLLERQLDFLLRRFDPRSVAVSVQEAWLPRCRALSPEALWTPVDPDAPLLASLGALLRRLPEEGWAFVHHVDMPVWDDGVFDALEARALLSRAEALVPAWEGRRGHPAALSPALKKAVLAADPATDRLDALLRARRTELVPVERPAVLENWNQGVPA